MTRMFDSNVQAGWQLHDAYWIGACIFILHFLWLTPSFLQRRNVVFSLVIMTAFWPLAYTFSIFQIMRMRKQKQKT